MHILNHIPMSIQRLEGRGIDSIKSFFLVTGTIILAFGTLAIVVIVFYLLGKSGKSKDDVPEDGD